MSKADEARLDPSTESSAYERMQSKWAKIGALLGGTDAMRAAGQAYLPQHQEEGTASYNERLNRATLLNMTKMTLDSWVGKPFSDPIQVGKDVPNSIVKLLKDVDLQGNNLDVFARNWFSDGLAKGLSHVLVEFPRKQPKANGRPRTIADDIKENVRPYFVHIRPENLIFGYAKIENGVEKLLHVRILEEHSGMDGFAETCEYKIRQIEPGYVTIYYRVKDPRTKKVVWKVEDEYAFDLPLIPLVTFYADRTGLMESNCPLEDLADLNIKHWQSSSDQTSVLTVARFPMLAVSGAIDDDKLVVGPNQWLACPDPAGRFYYVEHSGKAIAAGRQDLLDLQDTMAEYGAIFLKKRPGGASATAHALDSAETTSPLQDMAIRFQAALNQAMGYMAKWIKEKSSGNFLINVDFGLSDGDRWKLDALEKARKTRDVSRAHYLKELQRMGTLADNFDFEANESELKAETDHVTENAIKVAKARPVSAPAAPGPTVKKAKPVAAAAN